MVAYGLGSCSENRGFTAATEIIRSELAPKTLKEWLSQAPNNPSGGTENSASRAITNPTCIRSGSISKMNTAHADAPQAVS